LVTAFVLSAVPASTALATSAPYWSVNGTRLAAGQTHNITGKAVGRFLLTVPADGIQLSCKKDEGEKGVITGSTESNPGRGTGVLQLSGCVLEAGNGFPECKVVESTKTASLSAELVEKASSPKVLLAEFRPAKGGVFQTVHFEGAKCTVTVASLEGSVAAEIVTDSLAEETLELGQAKKEASTWNLRFPSTPITKVISVKEGVAEERETGLVAFSDVVAITGTSLGSLANSKFEPEETLWSPLP
jgi:hypothetical protein